MTRFYGLLLLVVPVVSWGQQSAASLDSALSYGAIHAEARTFFMSTINKKDLPDFHALATGLTIGYKTPEIKNLRLGIAGSFAYNVLSSDLSFSEFSSRPLNRYEIGLFDITEYENKRSFYRLHEFYLQYRTHHSIFSIGRIQVNTPFINPQDGRMSPTLAQGVWMDINEIKNMRIQAGWITHVSPRSTTQWYKVANSIGLYPSGHNINGDNSSYAGNIDSNGIGLVGLHYEKNSFSLVLWNNWVENISNTTMLIMEKELKFECIQFYGGMQFASQQTVGTGGNDDPEIAYQAPGRYANVLSVQLGFRRQRMDINVNATVMRGNGRYQMPREWGREPFYTFLPRERNEGAGDVKGVSVNFSYEVPTLHLMFHLGGGHYQLSEIDNFALNKYGMPSYNQLNMKIDYSFTNFLKDSSVHLLYVYKQSDDYGAFSNQLNKVNMSNINLVFNYYFQTQLTSNRKNK